MELWLQNWVFAHTGLVVTFLNLTLGAVKPKIWSVYCHVIVNTSAKFKNNSHHAFWSYRFKEILDGWMDNMKTVEHQNQQVTLKAISYRLSKKHSSLAFQMLSPVCSWNTVLGTRAVSTLLCYHKPQRWGYMLWLVTDRDWSGNPLSFPETIHTPWPCTKPAYHGIVPY